MSFLLFFVDKPVAKMADNVSLQIENALNSIINSTDKSSNLNKELRQEIHINSK